MISEELDLIKQFMTGMVCSVLQITNLTTSCVFNQMTGIDDVFSIDSTHYTTQQTV